MNELPGDFQSKLDEAYAAVDSEFDAKASAPAEAPPAEAAAEAPVPPKTDEAAPKEPTSEVSSPAPTPTYTKDYQDWLNKYGGDPAKADRAIWENNNRLAQLAKELDELKAGKAPEAVAPPAKEPDPVVAPEIKRFDESLRAIETKYNEVSEAFKQTSTEAANTAKRIREIERLRAFDDTLDFEKDQALLKELREKHAEANRLEIALERLQGQASTLAAQHETQTLLKDQAATLSRLTQAREAEITERTRREEDAALERFTSTFFENLPKIAKEGTDVIPDELLDDWKAFAKKESHVKLNLEDIPTADVPDFLRKAKAEYLASIDRAHRIKSKLYAATKAADAEVNAPSGAAAVVETPKKGTRSHEDFDRHIENLSAGL